MTRSSAHDRRKGRSAGRGARAAWVRYALYAAVAVALIGAAAATRSYTSYSRLIDARLHGERERTLPRVYARPVELRLGQSLSLPDLVARLNDLGYAERALAETPGEFAVDGRVVAILPRGGDLAGRLIRVTFPSPPSSRPAASPRRLQALEVVRRGRVNTVGSIRPC